MKRILCYLFFIVAIFAFIIQGIGSVEANDIEATVEFNFDNKTDSLNVRIISPVDVSFAVIKLAVPVDVIIDKDNQLEGFMNGATYIPSSSKSNPSYHYWISTGKTIEDQCSMIIPLRIPPGKSKTFSLIEVDLFDHQENRIDIATPLPIPISTGNNGFKGMIWIIPLLAALFIISAVLNIIQLVLRPKRQNAITNLSRVQVLSNGQPRGLIRTAEPETSLPPRPHVSITDESNQDSQEVQDIEEAPPKTPHVRLIE